MVTARSAAPNVVGAVIQERRKTGEIILEQPFREVPVKKGRLLDGMAQQLDELARGVDAVITTSGD